MSDIKNAFIYVSDALRWDYLPESVRNRGEVRKTVSASTFSPCSFTSILTGLHLTTHEVYSFDSTLPRRYSIHSLDAVNFLAKPDVDQDKQFHPLYEGVADPLETDLTDLEEPFVHVERDLATHAPYWKSLKDDGGSATEAREYLNRKSSDLEALRTAYDRSAEVTAERFEQRLDTLREMDVLEDTLVIFTADHGELLGEYCEFSHTHPVVPEVVYVPSVFIHPDDPEPTGDVVSHVDFVPTITELLDVDLGYEPDGVSVYAEPGRSRGICQLRLPKGENTGGPIERSPMNVFHYPTYAVDSVWDTNGGWVFNHSGLAGRLSYFAKSLVPSGRRRHAFRQNPRGLPNLARAKLAKRARYGDTTMTVAEATSELDDAERELTHEQERANLTEQQRDQLNDLGYI